MLSGNSRSRGGGVDVASMASELEQTKANLKEIVDELLLSEKEVCWLEMWEVYVDTHNR